MAQSINSAQTASISSSWDEQEIFYVLSDPLRRKLLRLLVRNGPATVSTLKVALSRRTDTTFKQLMVLRSAGLVTHIDDPQDGRRQIYSIAPGVQIVETPTGKVMDFWFGTFRV